LKKIQLKLLFIAWLVSVISTLASLYFSEVLKYPPCELCWYQRIAMYPLTLLLGIAIIKKHLWISYYSLFLAIIGLFLSAYQYFSTTITIGVVSCGSCSESSFNLFGFSIPLLSFISFLIIFGISLVLCRSLKLKHAPVG